MSQTKVMLGEAEVTVEYSYYRGEPERWNGLTGVGNPATPSSVEIESVVINGIWIGAENFSIEWVEYTSELICDAHEREGADAEVEDRLIRGEEI